MLKYEAWKFGTLDVFCASRHDTYAYRWSFMYVHVGGGAWIFNIPGGAIESPNNTFHQLLAITKFHVNLTNRCGDIKYFNLKSAT